MRGHSFLAFRSSMQENLRVFDIKIPSGPIRKGLCSSGLKGRALSLFYRKILSRLPLEKTIWCSKWDALLVFYRRSPSCYLWGNTFWSSKWVDHMVFNLRILMTFSMKRVSSLQYEKIFWSSIGADLLVFYMRIISGPLSEKSYCFCFSTWGDPFLLFF